METIKEQYPDLLTVVAAIATISIFLGAVVWQIFQGEHDHLN